MKIYTPREKSFPIALKIVDATRDTHTTLDVSQERRIDDYWNIDESRNLSDSWTGFKQFTLLKEKPLERYMWSGRRRTNGKQHPDLDTCGQNSGEVWQENRKSRKMKN